MNFGIEKQMLQISIPWIGLTHEIGCIIIIISNFKWSFYILSIMHENLLVLKHLSMCTYYMCLCYVCTLIWYGYVNLVS